LRCSGQRNIAKHKRVRTPDRITAVRALVVSPQKQPKTSKSPSEAARILRGQGVHISEMSVRRIIKNDLQLTFRRRVNAHFMTRAQKEAREVRCLTWLARHGGDYRQFIFSDESVSILLAAGPAPTFNCSYSHYGRARLFETMDFMRLDE
jgi:hypothetical protein